MAMRGLCLRSPSCKVAQSVIGMHLEHLESCILGECMEKHGCRTICGLLRLTGKTERGGSVHSSEAEGPGEGENVQIGGKSRQQ